MQFYDLWMKLQYDVETYLKVRDHKQIYYSGCVGVLPVITFEKLEFSFIEKIYVEKDILYIVLEDK